MGRKADVVSLPPPSELSIGFAWLDKPAPFSDFSGFTRTLIPVSPNPFTLVINDVLSRPVALEPIHFLGSDRVHCQDMVEPVLVLNLMSKSDMRPKVFKVESGQVVSGKGFLVLVSGRINGLHVGDCVRVCGDWVVEGEGVVAGLIDD